MTVGIDWRKDSWWFTGTKDAEIAAGEEASALEAEGRKPIILYAFFVNSGETSFDLEHFDEFRHKTVKRTRASTESFWTEHLVMCV